MEIVIAIDAMGGDFGPRCIVPASFDALERFPALHLLLCGQRDALSAWSPPASLANRLQFDYVDALVGPDERPAAVVRSRTRTSMHAALDAVRQGRAQGCLSAGNTGAWMALARQLLGTLPDIDRPAMMSALPGRGEHQTLLLDLGANLDSSAEQLVQFAYLGAGAAQARGLVRPRVALLNVGREPGKGTPVIQEAARRFAQSQAFDFIGFVEGSDLYAAVADVVVCDGFTGNAVLKSGEALLRLLVERSGTASWLERQLLQPWLARRFRHWDPELRNGASFLGLNAVVVKSHGAAGEVGLVQAIERALRDVETDLPGRIRLNLAALKAV
ncbi:phosphate acyltransferase PlsX [Pseudomonas sp. MOIL14HWK12:I1]|uniref:phosphate acyltransferase PlsX n=1 Tax=Pseudomonadaceae TaxID=135621 RepID=UPI003524C9C8